MNSSERDEAHMQEHEMRKAISLMLKAGEDLSEVCVYCTTGGGFGVYSDNLMLVYARNGVEAAEREFAAYAKAERVERAKRIAVGIDASGTHRVYADGRVCAQPRRVFRLLVSDCYCWREDVRAKFNIEHLRDGLVALLPSSEQEAFKVRVSISSDGAAFSALRGEASFTLPIMGDRPNWAMLATYDIRRLLAAAEFVHPNDNALACAYLHDGLHLAITDIHETTFAKVI